MHGLMEREEAEAYMEEQRLAKGKPARCAIYYHLHVIGGWLEPGRGRGDHVVTCAPRHGAKAQKRA